MSGRSRPRVIDAGRIAYAEFEVPSDASFEETVAHR